MAPRQLCQSPEQARLRICSSDTAWHFCASERGGLARNSTCPGTLVLHVRQQETRFPGVRSGHSLDDVRWDEASGAPAPNPALGIAHKHPRKGSLGTDEAAEFTGIGSGAKGPAGLHPPLRSLLCPDNFWALRVGHHLLLPSCLDEAGAHGATQLNAAICRRRRGGIRNRREASGLLHYNSLRGSPALPGSKC